MRPVPEMSNADVSFGNIKHMPSYADIPSAFKQPNGTPFNAIASTWFFSGFVAAGGNRLTAKPGVDRDKALRAVRAILGSFEPKHEYKEAACAYLLSEWFDLSPATKIKKAG